MHALQQKKLMTECQVLSVQSGPSLKAATKGQEQRSEEYEHSMAPYHRLAASSTLSMRADFLVGTGGPDWETDACLGGERNVDPDNSGGKADT